MFKRKFYEVLYRGLIKMYIDKVMIGCVWEIILVLYRSNRKLYFIGKGLDVVNNLTKEVHLKEVTEEVLMFLDK